MCIIAATATINPTTPCAACGGPRTGPLHSAAYKPVTPFKLVRAGNRTTVAWLPQWPCAAVRAVRGMAWLAARRMAIRMGYCSACASRMFNQPNNA